VLELNEFKLPNEILNETWPGTVVDGVAVRAVTTGLGTAKIVLLLELVL
jgi:hypothetical protein